MIRVGPADGPIPTGRASSTRARSRAGSTAAHLARYFDCVEINSSFYAHAERANAEHWAELVDDRPQLPLHGQAAERVHARAAADDARARRARRAFHDGLQPLADAKKLAALLVQFPHSFRRGEKASERLAWIAETFGGWPLVLELRHRSWFEPEPLSAIRALGYTLCGIDLRSEADRPSEDDSSLRPRMGERVGRFARLPAAPRRNARPGSIRARAAIRSTTTSTRPTRCARSRARRGASRRARRTLRDHEQPLLGQGRRRTRSRSSPSSRRAACSAPWSCSTLSRAARQRAPDGQETLFG
jgi:uncharacterized protein YecE (DUF72 family)